ncbi:hypothetical protein [Granulicella tundricola]|uniref:hypothetical protein n=1 Tax=Granulicella tundricola TaxID=940615 RepID=UPI00031E892B|nr:hypothetical protein [Granulicella tundricola]
MAEEGSARFSHRKKADGTIDSICLACLGTISSQTTEAALVREEEDHVCQFSFPARRSGRLPQGVERGRRQSDAEWEKHQTRDK